MTRKRHTEEQIIAVLKEAQAGVSVQVPVFGCDVLSVADEIRAPGSQRREETAPTGRRKPAIEADGGGASAGRPGAEDDQRKKLVRPNAKRTAATLLVGRVGLSQRRVCR